MSYLKPTADIANDAINNGANGNGKTVSPRSQPQQLISSNWLAPLIVGILAVVVWDVGVRVTQTPPYILPGPGL
ncbi:MAG: hypothetical protein AAGF01_31735, partial [Cyanobacteria bacterium P01_G01_bin.38]